MQPTNNKPFSSYTQSNINQVDTKSLATDKTTFPFFTTQPNYEKAALGIALNKGSEKIAQYIAEHIAKEYEGKISITQAHPHTNMATH